MCLDSTSANDSFSSTDCSDTASCASSEPDNEQSELRALCRRIQAKFNLNNRDKATTGPDTPASNNKSSDNNSNLMLTSNLSVKTLKYLSKLLALYKLDICKLLWLISVFFLYVVGDLKWMSSIDRDIHLEHWLLLLITWLINVEMKGFCF